jgi:hypothetical protein
MTKLSDAKLVIKNEINNTGLFWTSINNDGNKKDNLKRRINALNYIYFKDESLLDNWKLEGQHISNLSINCLCGKEKAGQFLIKRGEQICILGSECIKRVSDNLYKTLNDEYNRTTFDCKYCLKRVKKNNEKHGFCKTCNTEIHCEYSECYNCKFNIEPKNMLVCDCGNNKKEIYPKCYSCNFSKKCSCGKSISEKYNQCWDCKNKL